MGAANYSPEDLMACESPRACRFCGCTEARACPGGCAWATEDICTACLGHTPASWAMLRAGGVDALVFGDGARPAIVCLYSAAAYATYALDQILSGSAGRLLLDGSIAEEALHNLLLAAEDAIEATGELKRHRKLLRAIRKTTRGDA
jgi:hypothetical protein